ncbi:hypothetical protein EDB92DRAFT_322528 [Lactarius akahatsu]|uniref:Uncharacterized protein n=1 Tax=Lactarius akahatsu TaxID=416441 RepID=A0AAD4LBB4_9AGAM|nr:hypothetical protein EDB92DRAFT_322528 [Lactarius akahatsu]
MRVQACHQSGGSRVPEAVTDVSKPLSQQLGTPTRGLTAQYAICTFSLGVLQNVDVHFYPPLSERKVEAIHGLTMATNWAPYVEKRQIMAMATGNVH